MASLQEKNDSTGGNKGPHSTEAIHMEELGTDVQPQQNFASFVLGYCGICAADLMVGFLMYSDGTLQQYYVTAFQALSSFALLSTSSGIIQAIIPPFVTTSGDIIGYKKSYMSFLFLFILGCVLNGLSKDWSMFIAATCIRTIGHQGIVLSGSIIIASSLPLRRRGLWGSIVNLNYLVTAGLAPVIATALVGQGKWRVVYYIYIPIGVLLVVPLILKIKLPQKATVNWRKRLLQIDYIGFVLVIAATVLLTLPPIWGGTKYPWKSATIITCLVVGAILFIAFFIYVTKFSKAEIPVIQTRLFRKSTMNWAIASQILQSAGIFGWMMYLTFYGSIVMGLNDTERGFVSLPYVGFQAFAGILEGLLLTKFGLYKPFVLLAPLVTICGIAVTFAFDENSKALIYVAMGLVGIGAGSQYLSIVLSTQACHPSEDTPQAVMLFGFIVGIIGSFFSSITGAVFNAIHGSSIEKHMPPGTPAEMVAAAKLAVSTIGLDPATAQILRAAWSDTMRSMASYGIGLVALGYICSWFIKAYVLSDKLGVPSQRCQGKGFRGFIGLDEKPTKSSN